MMHTARNTARHDRIPLLYLLLMMTLGGCLNFFGWTPATQPDAWEPVSETFDGVAMVLVPPGCFMMGSDQGEPNERPFHEVCFDEAFWIDRYEVTNAQYARCVEAGACEATPTSDLSPGADQPLVRVSWVEAQAYCQWRGGRLPTEAEWEYAARGPDSRVYPWGDAWDGMRANACDVNCTWETADLSVDDGYQVSAPVGSFPQGASWVGAQDMSGNTLEWTSTLYDEERFPYPYRADDGREDAGDPSTVRVVRGGAMFHTADVLRAAMRLPFGPWQRSGMTGMRCALDNAASEDRG